jgi:hypothetical protein
MSAYAFPCIFCYTSGGNTALELLEHQKRRGHWVTYFDGKVRTRSAASAGRTAVEVEERLEVGQSLEEVNGSYEIWETHIQHQETSEDVDGFDDEEEFVEEEFVEIRVSDPPEEQRESSAPIAHVEVANPVRILDFSVSIFDLIQKLTQEEKSRIGASAAKTSDVWKNIKTTASSLDDLQSAQVQCIHCGSKLTPAKKFWTSTTNFSKHLKNCKKNPNCGKIFQKKITDFHEKELSPSDFQKKFIMCMVDSNISNNFLANVQLQQTFNQIHFPLPSRFSFWKIHDENALKVDRLIKGIFHNIQYTSISADGWSSVTSACYNALIAVGITNEWDLIPVCAGIKRFDKKNLRHQTAHELASDLNQISTDFGKNYLEKTILEASETFVADGTNLMPATANKLGKKSIHCISHNANLVLRDFILGSYPSSRAAPTPTLSVLCGVCSLIVKHFAKSTFAYENLNPKRKFVLYTKTRFYSFLQMIESCVDNSDALKLYVAPKEKISLAIDDFFSLMPEAQEVVILLKPFEKAFTILGSDMTPTSNRAILFYTYIKKILQKRQTIHAKTLLKIFEIRFSKVITEKIFLLANSLDPVCRRLTASFVTQQQNRDLLNSELPPPPTSIPIQPTFLNDIEAELDDGSLPQSEVERFLGTEVRTPLSEFDILKWWRANEASFPSLARLARKILVIPASSLSCERVFSQAALVVTKRRNRLNDLHINSLICCKFNLAQLRRLGIDWCSVRLSLLPSISSNPPQDRGRKRTQRTSSPLVLEMQSQSLSESASQSSSESASEFSSQSSSQSSSESSSQSFITI